MADSRAGAFPPDFGASQGHGHGYGASRSDDEGASGVGVMPEEQLQPVDALRTRNALWAVIFAGGIGSRFWPLSTPERPKPLLKLIGESPLVADTVRRLQPLVPAERVLVLTSEDIADAVRGALPQVPSKNVLVEPRPLGTAAALAWGAHEIATRAGPKAVFCALHADLAAQYEDEFRDTLRQAATLAANDGRLVAIGARPTRAETGFGYIIAGRPLDEDASGATTTGARQVARFVEKPGPLLAEELIEGGALWNTGIYVWQCETVMGALRELTPELQDGLGYLEEGRIDRFSGMIQNISLERGLLERHRELTVLPAEFGWDDVGTWACLRRVRELDDTGNGVIGDALLVDASSNVVHAEAGRVVCYGVNSLLVVSLKGVTFVTT
ncbi:MAG: sugar phosphate nucleotidyltransferase, partial [Gemmatimonadaceae bacterium]|nr:sugar phosphate nucleotidyltransferase [Gemmatimonadaceae bacterium]